MANSTKIRYSMENGAVQRLAHQKTYNWSDIPKCFENLIFGEDLGPTEEF